MNKIFDWQKLVTDPLLCSSLSSDTTNYEKLRCYHLCRPEDVNSYYRNGIQVFSYEVLQDKFRYIYSDLSPKIIDRAIHKDLIHTSQPQVHVGVDQRHLIRFCGHYAIYGSEYIADLSSHLPQEENINWQERLKNIGRPTILTLDIPFDELPEEDEVNLLERLRSVAKGDSSMDDIYSKELLLDYTISIDRTIPPTWIKNHNHPESIFDPLKNENYYFEE